MTLTVVTLAFAEEPVYEEVVIDYGATFPSPCGFNILLNRIGFESTDLSPYHSIHNGLTSLAEIHAFYYCENVAFGF